jgi:hypothetical protein
VEARFQPACSLALRTDDLGDRQPTTPSLQDHQIVYIHRVKITSLRLTREKVRLYTCSDAETQEAELATEGVQQLLEEGTERR